MFFFFFNAQLKKNLTKVSLHSRLNLQSESFLKKNLGLKMYEKDGICVLKYEFC